MDVGPHTLGEATCHFFLVALLASSVREENADVCRLGVREIVVGTLSVCDDLVMKGLLLHWQNAVVAAGRAYHFGKFNSERRGLVVKSEIRFLVWFFTSRYWHVSASRSREHVRLNSFLISVQVGHTIIKHRISLGLQGIVFA